MEQLIFIIIIIILAYLVLKLTLHLSRPFFFYRTFRDIDQMYNKLLSAVKNDIDSYADKLKKWQSNEDDIRKHFSEDELIKEMNKVKAAKSHEEEIYQKFLRCKKSFSPDSDKFSEAIELYIKYLKVRLKMRSGAIMIANSSTSGAMTSDNFEAAKKESTIILEETERKLDMLLK